MSIRKSEPIKSEGKRKKELESTITTINDFYESYKRILGNLNQNNKSDKVKAVNFFKEQTENFKDELATYMSLGYSEDEALKKLLPKAYATVKLASEFLWNKPHYDVQLEGGILLNDGYASQMATGEGKTLTASLPAYLNALLGKGVQVITPNAYLAKRDQEEMSELYELLGLTCGLVEEKERLTDENIQSKVMEILKPKLEEYTRDAKTEEEKQTLVLKYFNDRRNKETIYRAKETARKALRQEDIAKRQKVYQSDIIYASSQAVAFDYLYDDLALDGNQMVQRPGNPHFAIIDEVDAVLFDDAVTPFSISGTSDDEELALSKEELELQKQKIEIVNNAIYRIKSENDLLMKKNKETGLNESLIIKMDDHNFQNLIREEKHDAEKRDMEVALIINKDNKDYHLTTLGETIIFQYYHAEEINKILLKYRDEIIAMNDENGNIYQEGIDYTINKSGRISMEPRAFARLIMSSEIKELTDLFDNFGVNEYTGDFAEIDNAIKAWFTLDKDIDYKLSEPSDKKKSDNSSKKERVVSLIMNGRTAEGRVYSNGLQQAIEAKEKKLNIGKFTIKESKINNTLASIPTASFFARYEKFAGMTGTAAVEAFKELYGIETHEVRRNKKRQVIDHGERMYASTEEKNEQIFREVLKSYKKGQPVLLSTTSVNESLKLHRYLNKRFAEMGYSIEIPVLNANVNKLEEEAKIVAKAGMPKAITISTEMAGRGTDIKLGGEQPDLEHFIEKIMQEKVRKILNTLEQKGQLTESNRKQMEMYARRQIEQREKETIIEQAKQLRDAPKKQVQASGGLKVIGSGHFPYSRVDEQVKGRCGRQGDVGEIIFFNDKNDLLRVGVPNNIVNELQRQAELSPIIDDPKTNRTDLSDIIYDAQRKTESKVQACIKFSQKIEKEVAFYRKRTREQKDYLKRNNDYIDAVDFMIEETVKSILLASTKDKDTRLTDKTRLKKADFDIEELISLTSEFIGVEIDPIDLRFFRTVGEVKEFITEKAENIYQERIDTFGEEQVNKDNKKIVDMYLNRAWHNFESFVDSIKKQNSLNQMFGSSNQDNLPAQISKAYAHCMESERAMIVREIINPNYRKKLGENKPRTELVQVQITSNGVERIDKDYLEREKTVKQEIKEENHKKESHRKISNIQPRPRIFTLGGKGIINKVNAMLGMNSAQEFDSEMESIDFEDVHKGKK